MLVLTRRALEGVAIDGPAEIFIGKITTTYVKLMIKAPGSTRVLRCELGTLPPAIAAMANGVGLDDGGGIAVDDLAAAI